MVFSKSFGYAIRGILYVAMQETEGKNIQLDEIADSLHVPRYFMAKIMKKVVSEGFLNSTKGHNGGFSANEQTMSTSLAAIAELVGELNEAETCVLRFRSCGGGNPCPLHGRVEPIRSKWRNTLMNTCIRDLMDSNNDAFLASIGSVD